MKLFSQSADQGPWGKRGGSGGDDDRGAIRGKKGGGGTPPDMDELLRKSQEQLQQMMPKGQGVKLVALVIVGLWMASGLYRVQPDERGVVLRFGKWVETTSPGLRYHLPAPIETVFRPKVTKVNKTEILARPRSGGAQGNRNGFMLTGDKNIVDLDFVVHWKIKDTAEAAGNYLFKLRNPETTLQIAAESSMREIVAQTPIQKVITEDRREIQDQARLLLQKLLDDYETGIEVTQVQLLRVDPPQQVKDAFDDVTQARNDKDRLKNEAESYRNDILPRARGQKEQVVQEALAYKQEVIARSQGDASRFNAVYAAYKQSPDVTRQRMYIETVEEVLLNANKIVVDGQGKGLVPYLALPEIKQKKKAVADDAGEKKE